MLYSKTLKTVIQNFNNKFCSLINEQKKYFIYIMNDPKLEKSLTRSPIVGNM